MSGQRRSMLGEWWFCEGIAGLGGGCGGLCSQDFPQSLTKHKPREGAFNWSPKSAQIKAL